MNLTFLQLAEKVLTETQSALTAEEIWKYAAVKKYDILLSSNGKTPVATLSARLYVEVRDNLNTIFKKTDTRPQRFYIKNVYNDNNFNNLDFDKVQKTIKPTDTIVKEKLLHPILAYFGFYKLKAYLKTINHAKSKKIGLNEWVHPDVIGCHFPFLELRNEVVEISKLLGNPLVHLYSIELKRELNINSLRESFFQAVSNSSWANEGYIAAADVSEDEEFLSELERLSSTFGIGVIRLNCSDPDESEIVYPAKVKDFVDWSMIEKLTTINPDFRDLMKRIKNDFETREIRVEMYDEVLTKEQLIASLTN